MDVQPATKEALDEVMRWQYDAPYEFYSGEAGLTFARELFGDRPVILDVASFNERAIRVYKRAGFRVTGRHVRDMGRWGDVEFIDMELAASPSITEAGPARKARQDRPRSRSA